MFNIKKVSTMLILFLSLFSLLSKETMDHSGHQQQNTTNHHLANNQIALHAILLEILMYFQNSDTKSLRLLKSIFQFMFLCS